MSERLVLLGAALAALSGVPGLFLGSTSMWGQWVAAALAAVASALGLAGTVFFWSAGASRPISIPWSLPGVRLDVAVDGLTAFFLVPVFLMLLIGSVYGLAYWPQRQHPGNGRRLRFFFGTVTAGMALLLVARNSILFLFGWEIMALSAFFLVGTEDHRSDVRDAAMVYLVTTHLATLCLFALFSLMHAASGSYELAPIAPGRISPATSHWLLALSLVAFGLKAGLMPLHIWLPGAHAMTPSHVSALMSGVLIKMGIYGLVRMTSLMPIPGPGWGVAVLAIGMVSGILGVAFAIGQHDIKRLLAYHSIENIGIITMGLGLALLGRTLDRPDWVVLGMAGCLLHVWNHASFKALLVLCAGSVIHATHTREIDHLGGLARRMPWTSLAFVVGAVAICGLPPLNGFVSELLVYLGLFGTLSGPYAGASLAAPGLAFIGALAVACFVKAYGAVFLGNARSEHARSALEAPPAMLAPMAALVAICFFIGLAPHLLVPILADGIGASAPGLADVQGRLAALAPLDRVAAASSGLTAALAAAGALLVWRVRAAPAGTGATWGCGYLAPSARMQYTSSSFARLLVDMFAWALRPRMALPGRLSLFPDRARFHSDVPDTVLDGLVLPGLRLGARVFSWSRILQQGSIQAYLLYVLAALIGVLIVR